MSRFEERKARYEAKLTREDWQLIHYATNRYFDRARPKPGEPNRPSPEYEAQVKRIMYFLQHCAFGVLD